MPEKCLNIIVYYDNYSEVKEYVTDAISIGKGLVDVAVVVNKDSKSELGKLKEQFIGETIRYYEFGKNVGYLNSLCNVLEIIDVNDYKYIILSNTDICYPDKLFFSTLIQNHYDKSVGCIAPSVYSVGTDSYSNPHYLERTPKRKLIRLKYLFSNIVTARIYLRLAGLKAKEKKNVKQVSCQVYSPHGCYMIFTRDFAAKIKGYHYGALMYSEEACVGELLTRNNMKCYYDSKIEVFHNESAVTGKMNLKRRFSLWRESIDVILKEFYCND